MASDTTVTESETPRSDGDTPGQKSDRRSNSNDAFTGWFASSALRLGLLLVGVFLLLAALGQISGINLLGVAAELLGSDVGRWLLVAVVAIGLIGVAVYGFTGRSD